VATIELGRGKKVQRGGEKADPGGAADGRKQKEMRVDAGMNEGIEKAKKQGDAEDDGVLVGVRISNRRNDVGVKHAIDQGGDGKGYPHERAGGADVEEGAGGADGGAD